MSLPINIDDIKALSVPERILIVEEILGTIAAEQEAAPLTEAQKAEMNRRNALYEASPDVGSSWEEVKARLEKRA